MAQQTAVEWLITQVNSEQYQIAFGQTYISIDLIEQAKQMEKKQHKHTWLYEGNIDNASYERFERYYQVTFGGQGSPDTNTSQSS